MSRALLVVDIQEEYFGPRKKPGFQNQVNVNFHNNHQKSYSTVDEYMKSVNEIIEKENKLDTEIIYIQEVLPNKFFYRKVFGHSIEGTPGVQLHHSLKKVNKTVFTKILGDAFTNKELKKYIKEKGISEVDIIGCDSTKCAFNTAKGALKLGLKVNMVVDGLFTFYPNDVEKSEKELEQIGAIYK